MWMGQGIAFAALVAGAVCLELNDKTAGGLWVVIVIWALLTDWHPKTIKYNRSIKLEEKE